MVGAALVAVLVSFFYSAMLGFGVNERCSSSANSSGYCGRLDLMAVVHAVAQAALAVSAGLSVKAVLRNYPVFSRTTRIVGVVLVYTCVAFVVTAVYTHVAWGWANGSG